MIRPGRDRLNGIVETDETQLEGEEKGSRGRNRVKNALVAVAVEVEEKKLGRVRFRCITEATPLDKMFVITRPGM